MFPLRLLPIFALSVCLSIAQFASAQDSEVSGSATPITQGVNHIGLTVRDLEASTAFFIDLLGWQQTWHNPNYPSRGVSDGQVHVTLWQAIEPEKAIAFDRKNNVGLHHLALEVADLETLDELHAKLKAYPGVTIEFAPEFLGKGPTTHMMVYEPSGARVEFIVPKGRRRGQ